jgi:hypothetical protein
MPKKSDIGLAAGMLYTGVSQSSLIGRCFVCCVLSSPGTAVLDSSGKGADALVARAAFSVRAPGSVDLTGADDRWWVVRVDSIQLSTPPWDDRLAGRVRTAIAWEREQAHLDLPRRATGIAGQSALTSSGLRPATPDGTSRKSRRCC